MHVRTNEYTLRARLDLERAFLFSSDLHVLHAAQRRAGSLLSSSLWRSACVQKLNRSLRRHLPLEPFSSSPPIESPFSAEEMAENVGEGMGDKDAAEAVCKLFLSFHDGNEASYSYWLHKLGELFPPSSSTVWKIYFWRRNKFTAWRDRTYIWEIVVVYCVIHTFRHLRHEENSLLYSEWPFDQAFPYSRIGIGLYFFPIKISSFS